MAEVDLIVEAMGAGDAALSLRCCLEPADGQNALSLLESLLIPNVRAHRLPQRIRLRRGEEVTQ
jgi:hypothetical protein